MAYRDDMLAPLRWLRDVWLRWLRTSAKSRVDRSRMYCWVHAGLMVAGVGLHFHPFGPGVLAYYSQHTIAALAVCILAGSFTALLGALMGTRFWFPSAATDVRLPYMFAVGGQLSVIASLCTLIAPLALHTDLVGNVMAAVQFTIVGGCCHTAIVAIKEIYRINRLERIVRAEELARDELKTSQV